MNLQEKLLELSNNTNQLNLLAEAKNAGLIAFNSAVIIGLGTIISTIDNCWVIVSLSAVIFFNLTAVFISLASLTAQQNSSPSKSKAKPDGNLLFFGTICHMSPEELLKSLKGKYNLDSSNHSLELDYAKQLVIISQIASRKFNLFNKALYWTMWSILPPFGILIFYFALDPNRIKNRELKKVKQDEPKPS